MPVAQQTSANVGSNYATLLFVIRQLMGGMATATIVKVVKCTNAGGLAPVGMVDVQPLVNMMTGDRTAVPHGVLYSLPYSRLQGGTNAVILDPQPGDLGVAVFASRDISAVKSAKAQANPGSERQFNYADGIYIGGLLNGTPEQFVQFNTDGITVHSPTLVRVTAPQIDLVADTVVNIQAPTINLKGDVAQTDGDVTMAQDLTVNGDIIVPTGDVTAGTISLKTHLTSLVQPGVGTSGVPVP